MKFLVTMNDIHLSTTCKGKTYILDEVFDENEPFENIIPEGLGLDCEIEAALIAGSKIFGKNLLEG